MIRSACFLLSAWHKSCWGSSFPWAPSYLVHPADSSAAACSWKVVSRRSAANSDLPSSLLDISRHVSIVLVLDDTCAMSWSKTMWEAPTHWCAAKIESPPLAFQFFWNLCSRRIHLRRGHVSHVVMTRGWRNNKKLQYHHHHHHHQAQTSFVVSPTRLGQPLQINYQLV